MGIGQNIKRRRHELDMTLEEVAKEVGVSRQTMSRYETGVIGNIPSDKIELLAKVLRTTPAYIMGWESAPSGTGKFTTLDVNLSLFGEKSKENMAPSLSEDAIQVAQDYSALDKPGQRVVKVVIADQQARVKEEKKKKRSKKYEDAEFEGEETARVIPLYLTPPAAGYASPVFGEDFEYIEVGGDVPTHADYAVKIDGDSMEPYIMNGSTVYVNRDPLENGDVGIFFYDGDMLCKQYYHDEWGNVWLLSLNRDRADADRFIEGESELTMVCYGRVILPFQLRLAVPENELL